MAINKVEINNGDGTKQVLIDLTNDTVTSSDLRSGIIAHGSDGNIIKGSLPNGTAGTPSASKGSVSNHQISITPTVTNTTGYITGGTKTGTAVTVSASELVSGSETKTENGTYNVTNLSSLVVNIPIQKYYTGSTTPSSSLGNDGDLYLRA